MPRQADRPGKRLMDRPEYSSEPKPLTFGPDSTVLEAAKAMAEKNYGSVVLVDDDNTATVFKNWAIVLIGDGIALYSLLMVIVMNSFD